MCACFGLVGMPPHSASRYGREKPAIPEGGKAPGAGSFERSGDGRLWLFTRAWEPADKSKVKATLMIVHGTVDHSGVYGELAERLVAKGVAVFATDMRGWGLSDGEQLYFHDVEVFAQDVVDHYNRIHGAGSPYAAVKSRFLLGKSLGGLIAAFAASSKTDLWTGLIGLSGAFHISAAVKPKPAAKAALQVLSCVAPKKPIRPAFNPTLIVSDAGALREWERDPLVSRGKVTVAYLVEIMRAIDKLPGRIQGFRLPVLMLWGTGDKVVSEEGHELMYRASSDPRSRFNKYEGGFHNLLAEPSLKERVISDIDGWIATVGLA